MGCKQSEDKASMSIKQERQFFKNLLQTMKYSTKSRLQQCFAEEINWINGFPGGSDGKESVCIAGDPGLFPGLRGPGGGHGNPLQYSCLANPMDKRAWRIPWTEEPGRLQSMGSQRLGHSWKTLSFHFPLWHTASHSWGRSKLCLHFL